MQPLVAVASSPGWQRGRAEAPGGADGYVKTLVARYCTGWLVPQPSRAQIQIVGDVRRRGRRNPYPKGTVTGPGTGR